MTGWTTGGDGRLSATLLPVPAVGPDEVLVRVLACGVCRTDLHVIDGEIPARRHMVVPGHQVVGEVVAWGDRAQAFALGDRVGVAWLRSPCGWCRWCRSGRENLCPHARFTGWDENGGYAEYLTVPQAFACPLPADIEASEFAPLLCAGLIGFRALSRAALPPGGTLGLYGFGSSAHITAQVAKAAGATVFVMTRGDRNRALARRLGIDFVGTEDEDPPHDLDAAIVFAPAGVLVPHALLSTVRGGTVVLAGIHMDQIPAMDYDTTLFYERDLRSVTANTRADGETFLQLARNLHLGPEVSHYPFERVPDALADLRAGRVGGSLVVRVADGT